jgi:flagellar basal-body rod protein FlgC
MMGEFDIIRAAAAGMDAQRSALDLAARNVAAAQADGTAFERLVPRYALGLDPGDAAGPDAYEPPGDFEEDFGEDDGGAAGADLPIRYLGATPERGVDVDAVTEMVSVLDAQRAYEANASVFDIGTRLAERTIDVGRLE